MRVLPSLQGFFVLGALPAIAAFAPKVRIGHTPVSHRNFAQISSNRTTARRSRRTAPRDETRGRALLGKKLGAEGGPTAPEH